MKSINIFIAILIGFALSYIPNNYMDEKSENIAFYLVIAITIIGIIWSIISKDKLKSKS